MQKFVLWSYYNPNFVLFFQYSRMFFRIQKRSFFEIFFFNFLKKLQWIDYVHQFFCNFPGRKPPPKKPRRNCKKFKISAPILDSFFSSFPYAFSRNFCSPDSSTNSQFSLANSANSIAAHENFPAIFATAAAIETAHRNRSSSSEKSGKMGSNSTLF